MEIVYHILFLIFVLAIIFCIFGIGYYAGRAREFDIRKRVCDDIKKQIPNCSGEWLNGAVAASKSRTFSLIFLNKSIVVRSDI